MRLDIVEAGAADSDLSTYPCFFELIISIFPRARLCCNFGEFVNADRPATTHGIVHKACLAVSHPQNDQQLPVKEVNFVLTTFHQPGGAKRR